MDPLFLVSASKLELAIHKQCQVALEGGHVMLGTLTYL